MNRLNKPTLQLLILLGVTGGMLPGSLCASPQAIECAKRLSLESQQVRLLLPLAPNERIASAVRVIPHPTRLLYGTSLAEDEFSGGKAAAGRFLIHQPFDGAVSSVEIPPGPMGSLPPKIVSVSGDFRFAAASTGNYFGGPAVLYDLIDGRLLRVSSEQADRYRQQKDLFWRLFNQALAGDPEAENHLHLLNLGDAYQPLKNTLEAGARELPPEKMAHLASVIDTLVFDRLGRPGSPESPAQDVTNGNELPIYSAEFSQDGKLYALNAGTEIVVRESQTGTPISRIYPFSNPYQEMPRVLRMAFLRNGKELVTWHDGINKAGLLALWDTRTGYLCKQESIDLKYDRYLPAHKAMKSSKSGGFLVLSGEENGTRSTQLWSTQQGDGNEWNLVPVHLKTFRSPPSASPLFYPPIAIHEDEFYVVGKADGTVELYDTRRHALQKTFGRGHRDEIIDVTISPDGKYLVSLSRQALSIWPVDNSEPAVSLETSSLEFLRAVEFIPDENSRLILQTEVAAMPRIYSVDLFAVRAALRAP